MNLSSNEYFTEICKEGGTAFSFAIEAKLHEEQTPFQHIAIYQSKTFGKVMAIDGFMQLTSRDNFLYHEMLAHPALFTHPNPESVAIIGGGDCGTLKEVLQHDTVKQAWQIEIDERVTRLSEQYFPELCIANDDERANLLFADGIKWMAEQKPESLDVIIIDSTDPIGPAKGLFGENFYQSCIKALKPNGILVQQSESPILHRDNIIMPMHNSMRKSGFSVTKTLYFPQICYPSGWWTATMAAKGGDLLSFREEDINNREFKTIYYNLAIHKAAFAAPQFMAELLETAEFL